ERDAIDGKQVEAFPTGRAHRAGYKDAAQDDGKQANPRTAEKLPARVVQKPPAQSLKEPILTVGRMLDCGAHVLTINWASSAASSVNFKKTSSSEPSSEACFRSDSSEPQPINSP